MKVAWKTDVGQVRTSNEDSLMIDESRCIFLLADGMGGHNAGEIASDIAIKEAYAYMLQEIELAADDRAVLMVMEEAIRRTHRAIQSRAASDDALYGMGTTLVELFMREEKAFICHVGDSRAYLFRNTLRRITRDHTVGDSYIKRGLLGSNEVPHRYWHALTQAVGLRDCPLPDTQSVVLHYGDIMLLCSDGLTDMLTDFEIQNIVKVHRGALDDLVAALIQDANTKGGKDNISVIAVMR